MRRACGYEVAGEPEPAGACVAEGVHDASYAHHGAPGLGSCDFALVHGDNDLRLVSIGCYEQGGLNETPYQLVRRLHNQLQSFPQ